MGPGPARRLGDCHVAVVRQARNDSIDRMLGQVLGEGRPVARIEGKGGETSGAMGMDYGVRRGPVDVGEMDAVTARFGEQSGDQRADFAGAENQYAVQRSLSEKGRILPAKCA